MKYFDILFVPGGTPFNGDFPITEEEIKIIAESLHAGFSSRWNWRLVNPHTGKVYACSHYGELAIAKE